MAKTLWADKAGIVRNTLISGDIDQNELIQWIERGQDIRMLDFLGQNLYTFIDNLIFNASTDPVTAVNINEAAYSNYLGLLLGTVVDSNTGQQIGFGLVDLAEQWAAWYFCKFGDITADTKGIYVQTSSNGNPISEARRRKLLNSIQLDAEEIQSVIYDFLCDHDNLFPEYNNSNGVQRPPSYNPRLYPFSGIR